MATTFSREQFAWILSQRARFVPAEKIVAGFKTRWKDTQCTIVDVAIADNIPADWQPFFDAERAAFQDAPLGDKRNRIGKLNDWVFETESRGAGAFGLAAELLEQIAKEEAGAYAPKGVAGKPPAAADGTDVPVEEIRVTYVDPKAPEPAAVAE